MAETAKLAETAGISRIYIFNIPLNKHYSSTALGNSGSTWQLTSGSKPYYVHKHEGHYEFEADCIYYHTSKICADDVAVAIKNNDLDNVISWHSKQDHHINTT